MINATIRLIVHHVRRGEISIKFILDDGTAIIQRYGVGAL